MHGYVVAPDGKPTDVSTFISPSGAWGPGGIVSTPADLNRFIRNYVAGMFFGSAQEAAFVKAHQSFCADITDRRVRRGTDEGEAGSTSCR